MALRKLRPVTPSSRGQSVSDFAEITRSTPEKSLIRPINSRGGRNASGKITTRHQGGGHKRAYRVIDFLRNDKDGVPAVIAQIEYDPNRSARIALVHFADGEKRYIIAPLGVEQGTKIENGPTADIKPGNNLPLRNIPVGTMIHAIETRPGGGARIARSAGASVQLLQKMVHMLSFVCHLARLEMLMSDAAQQSVLLVMLSNQILTMEKLDVCAGKAVVQQFVVLL